ncbi:MAG: hypothetical protein HGA45_44255 [Chloroflexales bacterium]|nr:hypothetical protein [Chloroflexales bacterium]
MQVGTHFTGTVAANVTRRWFAPQWPQAWHVIWYAVPLTTTGAGAPQIELKVQVERTSADHLTYWLDVRNLSSGEVNFEMRYAIMG